MQFLLNGKCDEFNHDGLNQNLLKVFVKVIDITLPPPTHSVVYPLIGRIFGSLLTKPRLWKTINSVLLTCGSLHEAKEGLPCFHFPFSVYKM